MPWCTAQVKKMAAVASPRRLDRHWLDMIKGRMMAVAMARYEAAMTRLAAAPSFHSMLTPPTPVLLPRGATNTSVVKIGTSER